MATDLKLACYLDEAGDSPEVACATLKQHDIRYVVLRYGWASKNICDSTDAVCQQVRDLLVKHQLPVVAIISDLGAVPVTKLAAVSNEQIQRAFNLASYYGAGFVRVHAGTKIDGNVLPLVNEWMSRITEQAVASNTVPILELNHESHLSEPVDIAAVLSKHKRWKILYDPVQFILKRKLDPFVKYWSLLKNLTAAVDIRDYKIGRDFKPPGFGDSRIVDTVRDAIASGYRGWFFLEPSLGRRYGSALSRPATLKLALDGLQYITG